MLTQPANTTCTSDKVFFTTLYRTFEGLFTSFFTKRIISPRIFEWYCPYPRLFQNRTSTKNPGFFKAEAGVIRAITANSLTLFSICFMRGIQALN